MKNLEELMKLDYGISLRKGEDGGYVATVDELPGCVADGRTPNKAVENLREAMKSWMSSRAEAGGEIPEPRDTSGFSGKFLVRMPKSLHKNLSAQAASESVSLNQLIVAKLSEEVGKSSALEVQGATMVNAVYAGIAHFANSWTGFSNTARAGCQPFAHGANQLLTSGTYLALGVNMASTVEEAVPRIYLSDECERQKPVRRVLAA